MLWIAVHEPLCGSETAGSGSVVECRCLVGLNLQTGLNRERIRPRHIEGDPQRNHREYIDREAPKHYQGVRPRWRAVCGRDRTLNLAAGAEVCGAQLLAPPPRVGGVPEQRPLPVVVAGLGGIRAIASRPERPLGAPEDTVHPERLRDDAVAD